MARLSVVLTLYNVRNDYVRACVDSILNQTFQDFVILAMDDHCRKVDYRWLKEIPKVQYICNMFNIGMSRSVNKAFSKVDTEYCVRLGSDDLFKPTLFEREIGFLDSHPDHIAVCCELQQFGRYNHLIKRPKVWSIDDILNGKFKSYGYDGGLMFRSAALKKCRLDETMRICEDFDFQTQLLMLGKIHSIHEPLYLYRKHTEQITARATKEERYANIWKSIERIKQRVIQASGNGLTP